VNEIKVEGNRICARGSRGKLVAAIAETKLGSLPLIVDRVASFGSVLASCAGRERANLV
jgi:hypothetical protein